METAANGDAEQRAHEVYSRVDGRRGCEDERAMKFIYLFLCRKEGVWGLQRLLCHLHGEQQFHSLYCIIRVWPFVWPPKSFCANLVRNPYLSLIKSSIHRSSDPGSVTTKALARPFRGFGHIYYIVICYAQNCPKAPCGMMLRKPQQISVS